MPTFGTFTDSRDGHVYTTVLMPDGQWWAAENLTWAGGSRIAPNNDVAHVPAFGWLYLHEDSFGYAPPNTHVATPAEWSTLATLGVFNFSDLVSASVSGGADTYGLGIIMAGIGFGGVAQGFYSYCGLPYDPTFANRVYFATGSNVAGIGGGTSGVHVSIRFIVNGPPDAPAFYGNPFEGFEAGSVSVEIDRKLTLVETLGGRPTLIPYAPADKDEWLVTAEFWTSAAQAREIEMRTPPRAAPIYPGISVPARSGENTFAGLAPAATNGSADTYIDPIMLQPLEVLGQKDVRVDLYGYRASFSLSCSSISNPYSSNPATAPTTTPPAWLPQKWRVHSITDGSNERRVIGANGKWTGSGNPIAVNPIRPLSIQCDHLTTDQANELVAFFRGIRGDLFNLGFYPGPLGPHVPAIPDFVATKLTCKRDAGLLWSATLEVVAA